MLRHFNILPLAFNAFNMKGKIVLELKLGYGKGFKTGSIPNKNIISVLTANEVIFERQGVDAVKHALGNPTGTDCLSHIVKKGDTVAILTSDITRPMPTSIVMPLILDELYSAGISKDDITLVFACGSHRHHTDEERKRLAGDRAFGEIRCIDSDPNDVVSFGHTKSGTPVEITRVVAEADRIICLGNIEFHYFAGYSGGAKALMPGCSTNEAITINHSMMTDPRCVAGNIKDNPLRLDLEEAASMVGIDFILNVVLDEQKKIVGAFAGDYIKAHRKGCRFLDKMYKIDIPGKADVVIAANSGSPKDATLYQTQKALDNARHAVKENGTIILVGECGEGMGSKVFEEWMLDAKKPHDLIDRLESEFRLGGHKATAIATILEFADICLISELEDSEVRECFMTPYHEINDVMQDMYIKYGDNLSLIVMPYGGTTMPKGE